ncbi:leucyl aminopeptidase [Candidatus Ishikawella capsulata]|uniref:Probable cytosol aminopeptidase n=1 Tax=Candidatus Ishikawaella capsulata Mpkobe TaxID=476281 RepID=C5WCU8_9ENTR|nr:leucyl aminopeptidase [Candidatus Ishikawaella capsulata]BAH83154.1 leucyl aminopeptidase [Candidatus Ishikawaella capsulata Mpkobe]
MEFKVKDIQVQKLHTACIMVGIFTSYGLSLTAKELDKLSNNYLSNLLKKGELDGTIGTNLLLYNVPNIPIERVLLVGCGEESNIDAIQYKKIITTTINTLKSTCVPEVVCFLNEIYVRDCDNYWKIRHAIESTAESLYDFNQLKSTQNIIRHNLNSMIFNVSSYELKNAQNAIQHGLAVVTGVREAKNLSNLPPNICNARYLALKACQLSEQYSKKIKTSLIDKKKMEELGMNAYLAVGAGSHNEPLMSVIEYKGDKNPDAHPIVLIGKGLTFDSGGISIKPSQAMDEMKYDMCGAASVYGVMCMVAKMNLPLNILGILAGCENMPDGRAMRPGDVLTTMSGKTVEVLNTDAEGRLVLCDVLTYIERFQPELVIDIATLTGACIIALGHHVSGLMSNRDVLANELIYAGEQSGDLVWRLPLLKQYQEQLKSTFADIANIGGRPAGTITAACFLSQFAYKYDWAHLDIAGTAWNSGKLKEATGRPVPLLSQFLINRAHLKE